MILYHISVELDHNGYFQPDIPDCLKYTDDDFMEDITTQRVCASSTIEGCLSSIPDGGRNFSKLVLNQNGYFKLFIIDTEELGIQENQIIDGDTLYNSGLVYDAHLTGEHWILKSFQVPKEDTLIIFPYYWENETIKLNRLPFVQRRGYTGSTSDIDDVSIVKQLRFFADNGKSHLNIYPGPEKDRSLFKEVVTNELGSYRGDWIENLRRVKLSYFLKSKVRDSLFG